MDKIRAEPKKRREYSKIAIMALFVLCVGMILFACVMIVLGFIYPDRALVSVDTVLTTASGLLCGGVIGYMIKGAKENPEKIKAQNALDIAKLQRELREVQTDAPYTPAERENNVEEIIQ